jgi:hypothetical protein
MGYKQWNAVPTETLSNEKFLDKVGSTDTTCADSLEDPTLSVFIAVFENTSDVNSYEVSVATNWYARFDTNHAMMQAARNIPTHKPGAHDNTVRREVSNVDGHR